MARRSEHSQEQIREMVLKAAETIVIEDGFNALTVRKIALEIGYTVGSIYMVFANMNDLATHVKARTLEQLAEHLQQSVTDGGAEQQLMALADTYLQFAARHFNRWRMIFDAQSDAPVPDWYQAKVEQMFAIAEALFGQLAQDVSAERSRLASRALWSGIHGICILSLTGEQQAGEVEAAKKAVELLVWTFIQGWKIAPNPANAMPPE
ncbi:TetR/AcrR family transcriptional regulator [Methylomonas sp. EFPC3]|uniref:TetR/AcrR family transcriptional regulator n=1 Tax=unclassified Methylomonas TaxID=2608980 RepID=UPI002416330A|nr:TetR/AcrR family transcriptional regulator [Methylomonas sp. EFPC3]WFP51031.1 TetR/AcrR family transcriptional regulator [Methylomonas sp. EFPC3]